MKSGVDVASQGADKVKQVLQQLLSCIEGEEGNICIKLKCNNITLSKASTCQRFAKKF